MKKNRLICLLLAAVLLVSLCACTAEEKKTETAEKTGTLLTPEEQTQSAPQPQQNAEQKPEQPAQVPAETKQETEKENAETLLERFCGRYLYEQAGSEDQYVLELFSMGGKLYGEIRYQYDDETWFNQTLAEFEEKEEGRLLRTDTKECTFTAMRSSGFSNAGEYWDAGIVCTLKLTKDGLTVYGEKAGAEQLIGTEQIVSLSRVEEYKPMHDVRNCAENLKQFGYTFNEDTILQTGTVGSWHTVEDKTLYRTEFAEDGSIRMFAQYPGRPAAIFVGAYSQQGEQIHFLVERVGCGEMPYEGGFRVYNENDMLLLSDYEDDLGAMLPVITPTVMRRDEQEADEAERLQQLIGMWYNDEDYTVLEIHEDLSAMMTAVDIFGAEVSEPALYAEYRQEPDYSGNWYARLGGAYYSCSYHVQPADGDRLKLTITVYFYSDAGEESQTKEVLLSKDVNYEHGMG